MDHLYCEVTDCRECCPPHRMLCHAYVRSGSGLTVHIAAIVSCMFLVGACSLLQFRLGWHGLPVAAGCLAGAGHVAMAQRVCHPVWMQLCPSRQNLQLACVGLEGLDMLQQWCLQIGVSECAPHAPARPTSLKLQRSLSVKQTGKKTRES